MNIRMFIWSYLKSDKIQLEKTNQTRMNTEQLDMLYRQQIIDMIQDRVNMRVDQPRVIPMRRGALIVYGEEDDLDDYDSSYTEEEDTEDEGDDIDCETSEDDSMTEDDEDETENYSDPSDVEWLVDLMVEGQKEDEENTKDIKSVERIEKRPKKLAKK